MKAIIQNTSQIKAPARKTQISWWVPVGLILLSIIPLIFGALRLNELASGAEITPDNARFFASPSPVVIHIIASAVYALLGALQFVGRLWQRGSKWHRWVGRFLVPVGLLVGLSGVWMTVFYPRPEGASNLLFALSGPLAGTMFTLLPYQLVQLTSIPIGGAMIWLGYALFSERREKLSESVLAQGIVSQQPGSVA